MSVRHALLALLSEGPKYGLQLREEFEARTGEVWPLNVGQVYTTLQRLERDGLVRSDDASRDGREKTPQKAFRITAEGRQELAGWLRTPPDLSAPPRDELVMKLLVAVRVPGTDVAEVIQVHRRYLVELRTDDADQYTLGQEVTAETFTPGELVDVTARSKGKGFAGVMKRHGFRGLGASHGTQRKHRSPGSIGGCATPGRVFKGLRMAGRMGGVRTTVQSLTVHSVDAERGLLLIKGAVPGPSGRVVLVRSAARTPSDQGSEAR